jgi:hypothetical protein
MMLRTVHMAEGHRHHLLHNDQRVFGGFGKAQSQNAVHSLGVALAANIVAMDTPGFAGLCFAANGTFHHFVLLEILQGSFAN